jgi:hypothetical protein
MIVGQALDTVAISKIIAAESFGEISNIPDAIFTGSIFVKSD